MSSVDVLVAKHQNRMLLEGGADRRISRIAAGDVDQRHAAQLGGKTRTQRDDFHLGESSVIYKLRDFPPKPGGCARNPNNRRRLEAYLNLKPGRDFRRNRLRFDLVRIGRIAAGPDARFLALDRDIAVHLKPVLDVEARAAELAHPRD